MWRIIANELVAVGHLYLLQLTSLLQQLVEDDVKISLLAIYRQRT
ncbi:hypothetical protein T01_8414 [Trichinella spiralis]|uniref:Uncharacterized protein n=1 Tax=Trichinella spiralis TaxID=6334 RepID=A0A0V0Z645_TRISP|nr:hypothetical protein T01_8414 [Trichinella spiralis]